MDATYIELGTEVIITNPHERLSKHKHKGQRGIITTVDVSYLWGIRCKLGSDREYWWYPDELILASDEPLLRK